MDPNSGRLTIHTGIDLASITRIKNILTENKENFLARICTPLEREQLKNEKRFEQRVTSIFSLKESFSKALGTGIGSSFSFLDLEVTRLESGQPVIKYLGQKFKYASTFWQLSCSISHEGDLVTTIVIIQGDIS